MKSLGFFNFIKRIFLYRKPFTNDIFGYWKARSRRSELRNLADEFAAPLASGTLLDVGPGPGTALIRLAANCPNLELHGLETDQFMINEAMHFAEISVVADKINWTRGNIESSDFASEKFDIVMSTYSFQLWNDQLRGLSEISRVLKPNGVLNLIVGRTYMSGHGSHCLLLDSITHRAKRKMETLLGDSGFRDFNVTERDSHRLQVTARKP